MRKLALLAVLGIFALPAFSAEQTFTNAPVVDSLCAKKVAANPDAHTKECAMQCQGGGFGIVTQDRANRTIQTLVVTAHDQLIKSGFAGKHALDHLLIGQSVSGRIRQNHWGLHGHLDDIESAGTKRLLGAREKPQS